jgi:hypothetical protein
MEEETIILILTSSLVASLVTVLLNWLREWFVVKKREEKERYEKLYGPLKFYLLLMDASTKNKTELLEEIDKMFKKSNYKLDLSSLHKENISPLIKKYWEYIEAIMDILKSNPECIKKEHFPLVKNFVDGYIKREIVGKDTVKGNRFISEERMGKIIDAVEALKKEFLE